MNSLILLRGLPGAGKTELAAMLAGEQWPNFSIDDFFTDKSGTYRFDFAKNHLAYKACEENCRKAMLNGIKRVFIHNTFTLEWEIEPYFKMAKEFNYRVFVLTVENYHDKNNVHGISEEQIRKMAEKYKVKLY